MTLGGMEALAGERWDLLGAKVTLVAVAVRTSRGPWEAAAVVQLRQDLGGRQWTGQSREVTLPVHERRCPSPVPGTTPARGSEESRVEGPRTTVGHGEASLCCESPEVGTMVPLTFPASPSPVSRWKEETQGQGAGTGLRDGWGPGPGLGAHLQNHP